ncbi:GNAT family N-acetyltransferase [Peribacillus butanolivorans]|uniref:hypothetical protein n=1 Tax=Peribacillus butanolivorans TaxID=421767 RepID=UPI00364D8DA6
MTQDVTSIYILNELQGLEIGKKLLKRLLPEFKNLDFNSASVKGLEKNSSCHFYEAMGAKIVDSMLTNLADDNLNYSFIGGGISAYKKHMSFLIPLSGQKS